MMAAIDPFHTEKLSLLVSAGAAVNAQDNSGMDYGKLGTQALVLALDRVSGSGCFKEA